MGLTNHAEQRVDERLAMAGWTVEERATLAKLLQAYAARRQGREDAAVQVAVLDRQVNRRGGIESNGDTVWAVIRGGQVVTLMLRRHEQRDDNLRVTKVLRMEAEFAKALGRV